jgi:hypothetical protein
MKKSKRRLKFDLPRSTIGRCVFGAACVFLLPVSACVLWYLLVEVPLWPLGPGAPLRKICMWIVALAFIFLAEYSSVGLLIFSFFGLVWSFARPEWTERALQVGSRKMVRAGVCGIWMVVAMLGLLITVAVVSLL